MTRPLWYFATLGALGARVDIYFIIVTPGMIRPCAPGADNGTGLALGEGGTIIPWSLIRMKPFNRKPAWLSCIELPIGGVTGLFLVLFVVIGEMARGNLAAET